MHRHTAREVMSTGTWLPQLGAWTNISSLQGPPEGNRSPPPTLPLHPPTTHPPTDYPSHTTTTTPEPPGGNLAGKVPERFPPQPTVTWVHSAGMTKGGKSVNDDTGVVPPTDVGVPPKVQAIPMLGSTDNTMPPSASLINLLERPFFFCVFREAW